MVTGTGTFAQDQQTNDVDEEAQLIDSLADHIDYDEETDTFSFEESQELHDLLDELDISFNEFEADISKANSELYQDKSVTSNTPEVGTMFMPSACEIMLWGMGLYQGASAAYVGAALGMTPATAVAIVVAQGAVYGGGALFCP